MKRMRELLKGLSADENLSPQATRRGEKLKTWNLKLVLLTFAVFLFTALPANAVTINEFPVPTVSSSPDGITAGPDGNIWFTEASSSKIGRITTSGVITEFPIPTASGGPIGITAGPDGNLWFTEGNGNKIGRITTSGVITEFPIPTAGSLALSIAAGSDGNLWFTEVNANKIGRITTAGVITEFLVPTAASGLRQIVAGPDGNLWSTEANSNNIVRITTAGVITEFPATPTSSGPHGIATGPDGNLWFTEQTGNKIGRNTTAGVVTEFPVPSGSDPSLITAGPDGNLWFTEQTGNKIGRITTAGVVTEFPVPTTSSGPRYITAGPDGNIWFTEQTGNKIGQLVLSTVPTIDLPRTGQTSCYDANASGYVITIACSGTGQDGDIQAGVIWPFPRFTDKGDQTQTDNLTGLIWPKDGSTSTVGSCTGGPKSWQLSLDYVGCLNTTSYLGHSDWRLPNINELESLVNAEEADIATWLNSQGISNVHSDYYWSSSTDASYTDDAWVVHMQYGFANSGAKPVWSYVLPVRGGQSGLENAAIWKTGQTVSYATGDDGDLQKGVLWPPLRWHDNGDQTMTDNLTGLIWTKDANAPGPSVCSPGGYKTWQAALDYVKCLNTNSFLGHGDWRLPNRKELLSLIDRSKHDAALPEGHPFTNVQSNYYWSSSSAVSYGSVPYGGAAWYVHMGNGTLYACQKVFNSNDWPVYVWPVRGGTIGIPVTTDTTPDPLIFTAQTGVALSTPITSNTITVSGINTASPISITGGTYSINGGAFTSTAGTVNNGDTVQVRQTSSGSYSTKTDATLTVGGVSGSFDVTTPEGNRPPVAAFASGSPSLSDWTVTVTDASSDPDNNLSSVTVAWGDGATSHGAPEGTLSHSYASAGSYTIKLTATDLAGLSSSISSAVTVSLGTVTGTVMSAGKAVSMAKVQLTRTGGPNPYAYTNASGVYTINNVKPGAVTVTATQGSTTLGTKSVTIVSGANTVNFP